MRTPDQAIAYAASGPVYRPGSCLAFVVDAYQLTGQTPAWDAARAYSMITERGQGVPNKGAPLWWTGGQKGHGHVCLSDGKGGAWSTDFTDSGYVGDGHVHHLQDYRNIDGHDALLTFRGWSYDLENIEVVPKEAIHLYIIHVTGTNNFYNVIGGVKVPIPYESMWKAWFGQWCQANHVPVIEVGQTSPQNHLPTLAIP